MGQMRAGNPDQPPEERFASQLEQLASMGFVDRQANVQGKKYSLTNKNNYDTATTTIKSGVLTKKATLSCTPLISALIATMGDVNAAVERLLASNVQGQRLS